MTDTEGIGPQLDRAQQGDDPRGILVFHWLPPDLQNAEDSTQAADRDAAITRRRARGWERPATDTERILLQHLGFEDLPADLTTLVRYRTKSIRHRSWPQIEDQEITP